MNNHTRSLDFLFERIGNKLYVIRHLRKEKIVSVANSIGVSHSVISQVENGRYLSLSFDLLAKIASYYHVDIDDLLSSSPVTNGHVNNDLNASLIDFKILENQNFKKE